MWVGVLKCKMESPLAPLPPLPSLSVQLLTVSVIILQRTLHHNRITTRNPIQQQYDFIVVGAGSAGSIVAGRLTENPATRVLVLEAGGPQLVTTDAIGNELHQLGSDIDWDYKTTSQLPNAGRAWGGHVPLPRGRIVGGTHNMNLLIYSRGNRRNYDTWAQTRAPGWSYEEVLPYFLRSEGNTDLRIVNANPSYHSTTGPITVRTPKNPDPIITIVKNTLLESGVPWVDQNGPTQVGIGYMQQTQFLNATRATTASAYLEANMARSNLQVLTRAFVTRILFNQTPDNDSNYRATGVEYEYQGQTHRVYAMREVILSAGSINTPQLLMLSGVGPREHLNQVGINTLVNLPVGYHLQDHVASVIDFEVVNTSFITSSNEWNLENMYRFFVNSAGPLGQLPLVFLYFNSRFNNQTSWPDLQLDFDVSPVPDNLEDIIAVFSENRDEWREYYRPHIGQRNRMSIDCCLYRPRSIGRLYLNSSNPHDAPLIDLRLLTNPYDIAALTDSMRRALIITSLPQLQKYIRPYPFPIPGCQLCPSGPVWDCYSYLECHARTLTTTIFHQVGTCRMGNTTDDSVVDTSMRVRGTTGLRVIDGSIFPDITNGNTNVPIMMFAERGSDVIRRQYNI